MNKDVKEIISQFESRKGIIKAKLNNENERNSLSKEEIYEQIIDSLIFENLLYSQYLNNRIAEIKAERS